MKNTKTTVKTSAAERPNALGLSLTDVLEIEIRCSLNDKIIEVVNKKKLTHQEVAKLPKTSRTRVTALLNRSSKNFSTDLMVRFLGEIEICAKNQNSKKAV